MFRAGALPSVPDPRACLTRQRRPPFPVGESSMRSRTPLRRWAMRGSAAAFTAVALTAGMQMAVTGGATASVHHAASVVNPYSPAYHHAYRHGAVPTISRLRLMKRWAANHPMNASANNLNYGGGIDGIGVTTGPQKVYLVFYGSQWGTQRTNGHGARPAS